jgi:serine protease inhibitor
VANSVWVRDGTPPLASYCASMMRQFDADVGQVPASTLSGELINAWVCDRTSRLVDRTVAPALPADFALALVNAVHFYGQWACPFPPAETKVGCPFYDAAGRGTRGGVRLDAGGRGVRTR